MTPAALAAQGCTIATHGRCIPRAARRVAAPHEYIDGRLGVTLVGSEEQCDPAWVQDHADEVREAWDVGRVERDSTRARERGRRTLGERWDGAVLALKAESTVSAQSGERTSKSADDDREPGPPRVAMPDIAADVTIVTRCVERIERVLDEERGLVRPLAGGLATTEERDAEVWRYPGIHCDRLSEIRPEFGSPRTIMRARQREAERRKVKVNATKGIELGPVVKGAYDD